MIVDHDKLKSLLTLKFSNLPDKRVELVEFSSTIRWNLGTQERLISQTYKARTIGNKITDSIIPDSIKPDLAKASGFLPLSAQLAQRGQQKGDIKGNSELAIVNCSINRTLKFIYKS